MRVPSVGLPLDERRIVREGYAIAERMLRGYQDPPSPLQRLESLRMNCAQALRGLYRALVRH